MSESFKRILLAVFVVILGAVVWKNFGGEDAVGPARRAEARPSTAELPEVPTVQLAWMETGTVDYDPRGRNLFRYEKPPPTPEEIAAQEEARRRAAEEARRRREAELERQREAAELARQRREAAMRRAENEAQEEQAQEAVPQPPEIRLSYVGYVGPLEDKVAVLLDKEGEIIVGKEGEVVEEQFRILRIGLTYLEMGYTEFEGSKPLPLGEASGEERRG